MKTFQIITMCTVREVRIVEANTLEEAKQAALSDQNAPKATYYLDDFEFDHEDCIEI